GFDPAPGLFEVIIVATLVTAAIFWVPPQSLLINAGLVTTVAVTAFVVRSAMGRVQFFGDGTGDFRLHPRPRPQPLHRLRDALACIGSFEAGILLSIFYFVVMMPFGLFVRATRDPLRLRKPKEESFWVDREVRDADLDSLRSQFD